MHHFFDAITDNKGNALTGYYVRVTDSSGVGQPLYADTSLTPIISVSGLADAAKVDANGNVEFYIAVGTYTVNIYATDGTSLAKSIPNWGMNIDADTAAAAVAAQTAASTSATNAVNSASAAASSAGAASTSATNAANSATAAATSETNAASSASAASASATNSATSATQSATSAALSSSSYNAIGAAILPGNLNNATVKAATRAILAGLSTTLPAYLTESGREGTFVFDSTNNSANVTADPNQGVYVAPASDTTGASGAWVRERKLGLPIEAFGADGTATSDCSAAIVAAAAWSAFSGDVITFAKHYKIANCATITWSGVKFHFNNAIFDVYDTGSAGTTTSGATGKIGILFKGVSNLKLSGSASLYGKGTAGTTSLAGIVIDSCNDALVTANFYLDTMAEGVFYMNCARGLFTGPVSSNLMYGLQTFETPPTNNAGSTRIAIGCADCRFGPTHGENTEKPIVYLSLDGSGTNNSNCSFGMITGSGRAGSLTCLGIALRSAKQCTIEGVNVSNISQMVEFQRFSGDAVAYVVDGNTIYSVSGSVASTGASLDCAVSSDTGDAVNCPIGTNTILSLDVTGDAAAEYGLWVGNGTLKIGRARLQGFIRHANVTGTLNIDTLVSGSRGRETVLFSAGGSFRAGFVDIVAGPSVAGIIPISATGIAIGSSTIDRVRYRTNGIGSAPPYVLFDNTSAFDKWSVGHIDNESGVSDADFVSTAYTLRDFRRFAAALPTAGTWKVGQIVWNSAPAATGAVAWLCTVAGTPGTWVAMITSANTADIVRNVQAITSATTVTPSYLNEQVEITAQATGLTLANPTGAAADGRPMRIRIKDNGTARTIAYGTAYRAIGVTLPTTTVAGKTIYLSGVFNSNAGLLDIIDVKQEA
jgi:hypothetical protein